MYVRALENGPDILDVYVVQPGFNWCFSFAPDFSKLFGAQGSPLSGSLLNLLSPRFLIHQGDYHDLFV